MDEDWEYPLAPPYMLLECGERVAAAASMREAHQVYLALREREERLDQQTSGSEAVAA